MPQAPRDGECPAWPRRLNLALARSAAGLLRHQCSRHEWWQLSVLLCAVEQYCTAGGVLLFSAVHAKTGPVGRSCSVNHESCSCERHIAHAAQMDFTLRPILGPCCPAWVSLASRRCVLVWVAPVDAKDVVSCCATRIAATVQCSSFGSTPTADVGCCLAFSDRS